jgi:hypothetical protein
MIRRQPASPSAPPPLPDEEQQEAIIAGFEQAIEKQTRTWRVVLLVLSSVLAAPYLAAAVAVALQPQLLCAGLQCDSLGGWAAPVCAALGLQVLAMGLSLFRVPAARQGAAAVGLAAGCAAVAVAVWATGADGDLGAKPGAAAFPAVYGLLFFAMVRELHRDFGEELGLLRQSRFHFKSV